MELQGNQDSETNLEKVKQTSRTNISRFQILLLSSGYQSNVVMTQDRHTDQLVRLRFQI